MPATSYAQCGQDLLADFIIGRRNPAAKRPEYKGVYIDVGCFDPIAGSNTYLFYRRGWSGLCIDANPDVADRFRAARPNDTVVSCGVGSKDETLQYYRFPNPQHNTFNPGRAKKDPTKVVSVQDIPVRTLTSLIEDNLPAVGSIDLLSIDAEGFEAQILSAMDFDRFRPRVIIVEMFGAIAASLTAKPTLILIEAGYTLYASTGHDAFFVADR